ncbi:hypothetical protein FPKKA176_contig00130-0001 [Flavobacterium psychrophilum]|nr:hypothetical protein FPKKA176_contig00130-0001 [Flavobacterium psychrophilum]
MVLQDGEKCGGYTFFARKKNKINRKLTASEARHLAKPQNVVVQCRIDSGYYNREYFSSHF